MTDSRTNGISFSGALTIVFIVLKLVGTIDWSWGWVLSPIWIPLALIGGFGIIVFIAIFIKHAIESVISNRRRKKKYGF